MRQPQRLKSRARFYTLVVLLKPGPFKHDWNDQRWWDQSFVGGRNKAPDNGILELDFVIL
jgi:hypothetical protein